MTSGYHNIARTDSGIKSNINQKQYFGLSSFYFVFTK